MDAKKGKVRKTEKGTGVEEEEKSARGKKRWGFVLRLAAEQSRGGNFRRGMLEKGSSRGRAGGKPSKDLMF